MIGNTQFGREDGGKNKERCLRCTGDDGIALPLDIGVGIQEQG